ncbi:MAG: hypothetical protein QXN56_04200, partial [Candidatus Hadarchaeum sp.]
WNVSLYALTRQQFFAFKEGTVLKWYALTPEGPKFFDRPGVDPVYGIPLKPVTPDVVRQLKLVEKGEFKPIDPRRAPLFNPITGEPQAWYYRHPDGTYEFYDKPGFHPLTGVPLQPVTHEAFFEWQESVAAGPGKASGEPSGFPPARESAPEAAGQRAPVRWAPESKDLRWLVNRQAVPRAEKTKIALVIEGSTLGGLSPEDGLAAALRSDRAVVIPGLFRPEFRSSGYFGNAFAGQTGILKDAGALDLVDYIILGKVNTSCSTGTSVDPEVVSCSVRLSFRVVNKAGVLVSSDTVYVVGAGFSENAAFARALEMLGEQYGSRILAPAS